MLRLLDKLIFNYIQFLQLLLSSSLNGIGFFCYLIRILQVFVQIGLIKQKSYHIYKAPYRCLFKSIECIIIAIKSQEQHSKNFSIYNKRVNQHSFNMRLLFYLI